MSEPTRLQQIEAKRAARRAASEHAAEEQRATDLEAIDVIEQTLGDSNVSTISIPYAEGLPCVAAVRCPKPIEMKRYRDQTKVKLHQPGQRKPPESPDLVAAAELLAETCVVYPPREVFAQMCESRPGLQAQAGVLAAELALGKAEEEGKG
jgi:hypothetical protein